MPSGMIARMIARKKITFLCWPSLQDLSEIAVQLRNKNNVLKD